MKPLRALGLALLLASCQQGRPPAVRPRAAHQAAGSPATVRLDSLALFDSARQRAVPVALYFPGGGGPNARLKAALLSHGYGGHCTDYSFIARNLVAHGYFVASVQHELPTDAPLPTVGAPQVVRRPNWERGVQNLLFVRRALQRRYPRVDFDALLLVGHSNGGDTALLFAQEHPALVRRVISLDNRRMPWPRARRPQILSLRSSDQVADSGVVHTPAEQRRYGSTVVRLPHTLHDDMWDGATDGQKQEINALIAEFLTR
ncbi:serine aminopeptidase domain-containing protein [Hymenobacter caeli]|uniref:Dienelactone hydrolase n=1 Tax=Hymenobacter caeli TaxID=2735894 RepID=A0ABX2FVM4_9BACT|nr:alpha/beta hydrolase [Hymenobacter caeli]NRT21253.1 putative dienelactone hydrolase [Hymenobacter caeli]